MTKRLLLAAVLVAAMAGVANGAAGDPAVQRNGYWWNPTTGAKTDGDGNAYVNPVQNWTYFSKVYSDTICNRHKIVDSTGVYAVGPYGSGMLFIYPTTLIGSVTIADSASIADSMIIYLEVRGHFQQSADSSSTFSLTPWANNAFGSGPGIKDRVGHIGAITGATVIPASTDNGGATWSEHMLVIKPDQRWQMVQSTNLSHTKGFVVPLYNLWTPYFSLRFRVGKAPGASNAAEARTRLDVTYVGTPLK